MASRSKDKALAFVEKTCTSKEQTVPKFLKKTFDILEQGKLKDVVSWSDDGLAMLIKNPVEFAEKVLPSCFKHSNLTSFVRQLNMYNFKKRKIYGYDHSYGHEMFIRGHLELLVNIKRKCSDNTIVVNKSELKKEETKDTDANALFHENSMLKKMHKDLNVRMKFMEDKVKNLNTEGDALNQQFQKQESNQEYLKKVVYTLSQLHGQENIQRIIEAVTYSKSLKNIAINNPGYLDRIVSGMEQSQSFPRPAPEILTNQGEDLTSSKMCIGDSCIPCQEDFQLPKSSEWSLERQYLSDLSRVSCADNQLPVGFTKVESISKDAASNYYQSKLPGFSNPNNNNNGLLPPVNKNLNEVTNFRAQLNSTELTDNFFENTALSNQNFEQIAPRDQIEPNDDEFDENMLSDSLF